MIIFVTTKSHSYTLGGIIKSPHRTARIVCWSYDRLFTARSIRAATVIFTDVDRLRHFELQEAAAMYRLLKAQGIRVLNDPALCRQRYDLLFHLHASGFNGFQAYRASVLPRPSRFPVFLKCETDHRQEFDQLIEDQTTLDRRLAEVEASGVPLRNMLVIEFANTPWREGAYRRTTMYRIGDAMIAGSTVLETSPFVKYGTKGLSTDEDFRLFADELHRNADAETLRPVFELARIDYGRADFGLDEGRPVVYEINTNPTIGSTLTSRSEAFNEAVRFGMRRVVEAVCALDGEDRKATLRSRLAVFLGLIGRPVRSLRLP